ncbi:MAG: nuclear transport factor 2 family protein [Gemmatimonadota bacterium]|nr:nuclear transport factor 2 family protein [Gemmatimonadota bacterium]MDH5282260.1 nuclear transport factor 2 family protein [Gemmatimonadota bacterium]
MHPARALVLLVFTACSAPPGGSGEVLPDPIALRDTIIAQFSRSAEAWTRGDLDAFMADYVQDSLTGYVTGGRVQHGFDRIRAGYAPRFAPGATRDSLRFENFEVRPLAPRVALVTARFVLFSGGNTSASGPFSLVMERRPDGWKILHDHTSSD